MSSQVIAWKEPPASTNNRGRQASERLQALAFELKARRGQWGYIGIRKSAGTAYDIRGGKSPAFQPKGSFEARAVKTDDGDYDIYVRYVGEQRS